MLAALSTGNRSMHRVLRACAVVPAEGALAATAAAASSCLWCRWQASDASAGAEPAGQAAQQPSSGLHGQQQQEQQQERRQQPPAHPARQHSHTAYAHGQPFAAAGEEGQEHEPSGVRADSAAYNTQRAELLAAALRHVPACGWSGGAAAAAAAAELGLSPAAAGMLGSDSHFVQLFVADCNRRLEAELAGMQAELAPLEARQRLLRGLRLRLAMLEPYVASWPQALSLLAAPSAAPRTLQLYAELADTLWHAAGDTSADLSWYAKRALLTGVYSATELYMLTDASPGFSDTWAALDRRLEDAFQLAAAAGEAGSLAGAAGGVASMLAAGVGSFFRRPPPL